MRFGRIAFARDLTGNDMRSGVTAPLALDDAGHGFQAFLRRQAGRLAGLGLFAAVAFGLASLGTWNVADPSFSHATDNPVTNAMGYPGAVFADLAMQFFGLASVAALMPAVIWGVLFVTARGVDRMPKRGLVWFGSALLGAAIAGCVGAPPTWPLPTGLGGVFGDMVLKVPGLFIGGYPTGLIATVIGVLLIAPAIWLFAFGAGLLNRENGFAVVNPKPKPDMREQDFASFDDEDEDENEGVLALGAIAHWWLSARAWMRRRAAKRRELEGYDLPPVKRESAWRQAAERVESAERAEQRVTTGGRARVEPEFFAQMVSERTVSIDPNDQDVFGDDDDMDMPPVSSERRGANAQVQNFRSPEAGSPAVRVAAPAPRPAPGARVQREAQTTLIGTETFEMPSLHFLAEPKNVVRDASLSKDALEQNARLLEGVLEDFGVKGEIIHVRPGPVVTLYELEPAPGIKSSRVIGLADDIARSMSAVSARVATVPGRNVIGIELPNARRETVFLRELLSTRHYEDNRLGLPLALGKDIGGDPVIADLSRMPHLLIGGTTGSGKSVAVNTMILSLLYRLPPDRCRFIMIDPKMLELSVYQDIPHLLTPVVTEPRKAIVALKWVVREMEDRYRAMSSTGVRNIAGYNERLGDARRKGQALTRQVQTGIDPETRRPIFEEEEIDLTPLPFIVVIIDEMADLMLVAGKEIEAAVQRLAQMARAAGIHVIMATQRPSVDVITGTIKANFPTRISFQVTSKIDSRTILGEQGGEQLLGQGDMLYMAGGGKIARVHGPFASDGEVEEVVRHLRAQGVPSYIESVTNDPDGDEGGLGLPGEGGEEGESDQLYDQAIALVARERKCSTSFIQRYLQIGYNRAARIVERMEREGVVSSANHVGKREVLARDIDDRER